MSTQPNKQHKQSFSVADALMAILGIAGGVVHLIGSAHASVYRQGIEQKLPIHNMSERRIAEILDGERTLRPRDLDNSAKATLYRLKKRGYITKRKGSWQLLPKGEKYLRKTAERIKPWSYAYVSDHTKVTKELVLIFDIPERRRRDRDWLRTELRQLGFEQLQQSAWHGPMLPHEFAKHLRDKKLLKYIHVFHAHKKAIV